jgi:hypothetical protein
MTINIVYCNGMIDDGSFQNKIKNTGNVLAEGKLTSAAPCPQKSSVPLPPLNIPGRVFLFTISM